MQTLLLISLWLAAVPTPATQTAADTPEVRELQRLETVWNVAQVRGDAEALDALWDNDLEVAVPKMPVMTKAEALAFARAGRMKFNAYETYDLKVRVYGSAAVVTGRLQRTRTMNGQSLSDDWRFTKVYIKRSDGWRVVAFQSSEAAKP